MRIYVASSWRNRHLDEVISKLEVEGRHRINDFRHPRMGPGVGFRWSEIDSTFPDRLEDATTSFPVAASHFTELLQHPRAKEAFLVDYQAMEWADAFVLVLPCNRSAHLELGWAVGRNKLTAILLDSVQEPELMYSLVDYVAPTLEDLVSWLNTYDDF